MAASNDDLERLYQRRYRSFRHGAAAILRDYEQAHDVVQGAFARAIGARDTYRGGSLDAWVWQIVKRCAIDALGIEAELPLPDSFELPVEEPERDPDLVSALAELPPRRRQIIFLRYFADLPYGEIARLCGIEEGTVAATLASAHAQLRKALTTEEAKS